MHVHVHVHVCRYRQAYVDNQMALSLDRSLDTVYAANSRLRTLLLDQDGNHWKDKLPEHPQLHSINQALSQRNYSGSTGTTSATSTAHATKTTNTADTSNSTDNTTATATTEDVDGAPVGSSSSPAPPLIITASTATTPADLETNVGDVISTPSPQPPSLLTNSQHLQVTQVTTPISTTTPTPPPKLPTQQSSAQKFENAKAKGNQHVKKVSHLLPCLQDCQDHSDVCVCISRGSLWKPSTATRCVLMPVLIVWWATPTVPFVTLSSAV